MKEAILITISLLLLVGCKQGNPQNNAPSDADSTAVQAATDSTEVSAAEEGPTTLSFDAIMQMVKPGQKLDEKTIEECFAKMELPKVEAERYISDADFGGDSPAISYTWGRGVSFKNWKFTSTEPDYFGTHFNFFFDESRKTGTVKQFDVITSDPDWYQIFMADAKAAGMKFNGNLDKAVYQKEGKEYTLKTGEETYYFINDFSANGKYEVEMGYETGIDL